MGTHGGRAEQVAVRTPTSHTQHNTLLLSPLSPLRLVLRRFIS